MKALGIRDKEYQLGKTKIFIKHPKIVFRIEEERDDKIDEVATRLQLVIRLANPHPHPHPHITTLTITSLPSPHLTSSSSHHIISTCHQALEINLLVKPATLM
jgi:hypothetical protein